MFEVESFDGLSDEMRAERLREIDAVVKHSIWIDALAEASWGAVALYDPDLRQFHKAFTAMNEFFDKHSLQRINSQNTFVRFLRREMLKPRAIRISSIVVYLLHLRATQQTVSICVAPIENMNSATKGLLDSIATFLVDGDPQPLSRMSLEAKEASKNNRLPANQEDRSNKPLEKSRFFETIWGNVNESIEENQIFMSSIFGNIPRNEQDFYANTTYFLTYRYSTMLGKIVKTFLVVQTGAENRLGFLSYAHFLRGGKTRDNRFYKLRKETRGFIVNLRASSYLIGRTVRSDYHDVTNIEIIGIDREKLLVRDQVIHAVCMSSAASDQPIISRLVLVKIGDRRSFGKILYDRDVEPAEIDDDDLEGSFDRDMARLREKGFPVDARTLTAGSICPPIREGINNIPLAERENRRSGRNRNHTSRGAIEAWGGAARP